MTDYDSREVRIQTRLSILLTARNGRGVLPAEVAAGVSSELRVLRNRLQVQAQAGEPLVVDSTMIPVAEVGQAIRSVSEAEAAAADRDPQRIRHALGRSGRWLATFAREAGAETVAALIIRAGGHG